jgi:hypothetical protein
MASLNHSRYLLPKSPGWTRYVAGISYWCWNYGRVISAPLLYLHYFFGWVLAGIIIGIGLLIIRIQMVFASQRKICKNSWPLILNILYLVQYLLMNKNENKHEPSKQPSENYYSGETIVRLHTEVIYCK